MPPVIHFSVLASSSAGNAALIEAAGQYFLVDAGISARRIIGCLSRFDLTLDDLSAVFVTHEHGDHIKGLDQISRRISVKTYCTRYTGLEIREKAPGVSCRFFEPGRTFELGALRVTPFEVSHDAVDPVGFRFDCGEASLGWLTDTGSITRRIPEYLSGVDALYLESNYNPHLLAANLKRPRHLKQRIASAQGHLSNEQACELVEKMEHSRLEHLVLAHLSRDCNTPALACEAMRQTLDRMGRRVELLCASPDESLPWIEVAPACAFLS